MVSFHFDVIPAVNFSGSYDCCSAAIQPIVFKVEVLLRQHLISLLYERV